MLINKEKKINTSCEQKYRWKIIDVIDPSLSDEDIKNIINKKIARIIIEMEHSPANYINKSKKQCNIRKSTV